MRSVIIHNLPDWRVTSYGNGLAYEIAHKPSMKTIFFQGDDAAQFRDEFDQMTEASNGPQLDFADALRAIWHDYGSLAQ